jgi:hypothetical protein
MHEAQIAAIGAIETGGGGIRCTGTLISDRWVITAKHCVIQAQEPLVFRTSVDGALVRVPLVTAIAHPTLDALLFRVPPLAAIESADIQPIAIRSDEILSIGDQAVLAGYGDTELGTDGSLLFLNETVIEVDEASITVDGGEMHGACFGDSGGPLLRLNDKGEAQIIGVLSGGKSTCVGRDRYVRLDSLSQWIEQNQLAGEADPCAGYTWEGTCEPGRATWCDADEVTAEDCVGKQLCGWDPDESGYRCVEDTEDPCRGIGSSSACDGTLLLQCERGVLLEVDCSTCDRDCVQNGDGAACE